MANRTDRYIPGPNATKEQKLKLAFNCGRDLAPDDRRSDWIDSPEQFGIRQDLLAEYHQGQEEQYECEDW